MPPRKRPTDQNQLAKLLVDQLAGSDDDVTELPLIAANRKNPAAVALGRLGGKKGGPARAMKLSTAERKRIASNAAKARWKKSASQKRR